MQKYLSYFYKIYQYKVNILNKTIPIVDLLFRVQVGLIFWRSGVLKVDNWDTTLWLFSDEHPVPFMPKFIADGIGLESHYLPAEFAAIMGTSFEIICPILLLFGFGARIAAFILLIMTTVIEYSYIQKKVDSIWDITVNILEQSHSNPHVFWALLMIMIIVRGAGVLSLDHLVKKYFSKKYPTIK